MKIKELKQGDVVRCFGSTGAYLSTVQRVVTDMTHHRDIGYVKNHSGYEGTLTDNDEWLFVSGKVKSAAQEVSKRKRAKDLRGLATKMKDKQHVQSIGIKWEDDKTLKTDNGRYVKIPDSILNDENESIIDYLQDELKDKQEDIVNRPSHYTYGKIEVIDFVEQVTASYPPELAFAVGNAIKYLSRAQHKNGKQDIEKAQYYVNRIFEKWEDK